MVPNRRVPQQSRSQNRVNLILDTASGLFCEIGYDATTTNAIAEKAGISIGSLYQYFPDKFQILVDLVERYRAQLMPVLVQIDSPEVTHLPPSVLIDRLVDPFLAFFEQHPVYRHLLLGADVSPDISHAFHDLGQEMDGHFVTIFQRLVPSLDLEHARIVSMLCGKQLQSLLSLRADNVDPRFREQITTEVKRMYLAYLEKYLGEKSTTSA